MPDFIHNFFAPYGVINPNEQLMLLGLVGAAVLCLLLRIVLVVGYQGQSALVSLFSKEMKSKEDIDALKIGPFARAAKEYVVLGDRGVTRIDTRAIVERNTLKMSFLFWNFKSIETFVTAIEWSILPMGLLFALFAETLGRPTFLVFIVCTFLAARVLASFIDFNVCKNKFITNTVYLLDKEIGRFYASDSAAALTVLQTELKNSMKAQGELLAASIEKMGADFSATVAESLNGMTAGVERTAEAVVKNTESLLNNMSSYTLMLSKPLDDWSKAIAAAGELQAGLNTSLGAINTAISYFASTMSGSGTVLSDFKAELAANTQAVSTQIEQLATALEASRVNSEAFAQRGLVAEEQMQTVRTHQETLEKSIQQYEVSLRDITVQLGESMGKMVDFHLQQSYGALTDGVKESLSRIMTGNNELLTRLQDLFAQMQGQSRSETAAIISIKDQMDLHFTELKKAPSAE